jgi:hypothetical protein
MINLIPLTLITRDFDDEILLKMTQLVSVFIGVEDND